VAEQSFWPCTLTVTLQTILMSTLWAFGFFMAILSMVGNTTRHDDWRWLWCKLRGYDVSRPDDARPVGEAKPDATTTTTFFA